MERTLITLDFWQHISYLVKGLFAFVQPCQSIAKKEVTKKCRNFTFGYYKARGVGHDVTMHMVLHNLIEFQRQLHDEKPNIPTT